ncbi:MAG: pilus assembly protein [Chloroflexota bacterium]|nr:pilus assembly protein [Chloroflexota bacterium]
MLITLFSSKRSARAQATIEFAFVLPILVLLLMGIFDFGRVTYANTVLANAAREGVRKAAVGADDATIKSTVTSTAVALSIDPNNITVSPPQGSRGYGVSATIVVSFTFVPVTPLIGRFFGPSGNIVLTNSASMVVE